MPCVFAHTKESQTLQNQKYNVSVKKAVTEHAVFFSGDWLYHLSFSLTYSLTCDISCGRSPQLEDASMDDDVIDLSDEQTYKETMRKLDKESVCPCAECVKRLTCEAPHYCVDYKRWRKLYMQRRYG